MQRVATSIATESQQRILLTASFSFSSIRAYRPAVSSSVWRETFHSSISMRSIGRETTGPE